MLCIIPQNFLSIPQNFLSIPQKFLSIPQKFLSIPQNFHWKFYRSFLAEQTETFWAWPLPAHLNSGHHVHAAACKCRACSKGYVWPQLPPVLESIHQTYPLSNVDNHLHITKLALWHQSVRLNWTFPRVPCCSIQRHVVQPTHIVQWTSDC